MVTAKRRDKFDSPVAVNDSNVGERLSVNFSCGKNFVLLFLQFLIFHLLQFFSTFLMVYFMLLGWGFLLLFFSLFPF